MQICHVGRQLGKAEELGSSSAPPFLSRTLLVIGPGPFSWLPARGPLPASSASQPTTACSIGPPAPFSSLTWPGLFVSRGLCTCHDCYRCVLPSLHGAPESSVRTKLKISTVTEPFSDLPIQRSPSPPGPSGRVLLMSCLPRSGPTPLCAAVPCSAWHILNAEMFVPPVNKWLCERLLLWGLPGTRGKTPFPFNVSTSKRLALQRVFCHHLARDLARTQALRRPAQRLEQMLIPVAFPPQG